MSELFHMQMFKQPNEYVIVTFTIIVVILSYVVTFKCCLRNKNKTITFDHNGITTKLISDTMECSSILNQFMVTNPKVIGLDCEWVGKHKISLLQIANNNLILLIRLHQLSFIPVELIRLLGNIEIIKCGVGIKNDVKKLRCHYNLETVGCIELNTLYQQINMNENMKTNMSLKKLYKLLFHENMKYKQTCVTRSNWEAQILNDKQCHYAADDALVGYQIFVVLIKTHLINTNIKYENENINYLQILYGLIDNFSLVKPIISESSDNNKNNNNNHKIKTVGFGPSNVINNVGKRTLFDNCKILQPDGSLLGFCSKFALKWHLDEGLAIKLDETSIKLKKTKPVKIQIFDEYIRTESPNICFVCGITNNLRKYSVFPIGYTRYINPKYYDRSCFNHDNILLCLLCNKKAQKIDIQFKKLLCQKYKNVTPCEIPTKLWYAIKCAKTLRRDERRKQIPIYKQIQLLEHILTYVKVKYKVIYDINKQYKCVEQLIVYGFMRINGFIKRKDICETCLSYYYNKKDIATNQLIELVHEKEKEKEDIVLQRYINELADFDQKKQLKLHCKELVATFNEKQLEFIEMWRKNFIHKMKPRFMPNNW